MVTCWERTNRLALLDVMCFVCVFLPCGVLGQLWYLIASTPDHCLFHYFTKFHDNEMNKRVRVYIFTQLIASISYCSLVDVKE